MGMANLTRSNIAYNLHESPHDVVMHYEDVAIRYVFSSELYKNNFISRFTENRNKINQSLSNRFGFHIKANKLADLKLYTTIEKRGFLVCQGGDKFECPENIILDGQKLTTMI